MSKLLKGTLILTGATFLSKFLGLIFIIPFANMVHPQGVALYGYAYTPYTILLSIATMGVPLAVSKFVSKYNALGDYATGRRLLRTGLLFMSLTGIIAFLILFFAAESIAGAIVNEGTTDGNSIADVTLVIKMVSTALLIVPIMSLLRGFFQGYQSMGPTGLSQVIEQVLRIGFILLGSYIVLQIWPEKITTAVAFATFAAFIGAIGGLAVLIWYWKSRKPHLDEQLEQSTVDLNLPLVPMYKELITYAVPFVAVGLAIPLYQLVDQFTINRALMSGLDYTQGQAEEFYAVLTQNTHKIIMIPVSLATGFALTLIPVITEAFTKRNFETVNKHITQTFQVILFLTVPAAIGLAVLAFPAFKTLFPTYDLVSGGPILQWYAPTAILFALFTVTAAMLQGINQQKFAVFSLLGGVGIKLGLNYFLIAEFGIYGSIIATNLGYLFSVSLNGYIIKKHTHYNYTFILKRALLIAIFTVIMVLIVQGVKIGMDFIVPGYKHYWKALAVLFVGVLAGAGVYLWLGIRSNLANQVFGNRLKFLQKRKARV
jgi:O-antigen/teichoic acid export membrane protein